MDIIEIHEIRNPPGDLKLLETALSSTLSEFISKNPNVIITNIAITYTAGTPSKTVTREIK
jgi:hypothetical protein